MINVTSNLILKLLRLKLSKTDTQYFWLELTGVWITDKFAKIGDIVTKLDAWFRQSPGI